MERISKWYSKLRIWAPISMVGCAVMVLMEVAYVQSVVETKTDPLALGSNWALEIPYLFFGLINFGIFVTILVLLMGFMLRSGQLIKSTHPQEFVIKPGWAIWSFFIPIASYFIPYQILGYIRNFANYDEVKRKANTKLLLGFWIPYSIAGFLGFQLFTAINLDPTYAELVESSLVSLVSSVLSLISSVFLIWLVPALYTGIQKRMSESTPEEIATTS